MREKLTKVYEWVYANPKFAAVLVIVAVALAVTTAYAGAQPSFSTHFKCLDPYVSLKNAVRWNAGDYRVNELWIEQRCLSA